jgi:hypothetical protein
MDEKEGLAEAYSDYYAVKNGLKKPSKRKTIKRKSTSQRLWGYIKGLFDWRTWRHAYGRWCFFAYMITFVLRGNTVDGLVLFFLILFMISFRAHHCEGTTETFIPYLAKGEKISEYGYRLALANSLYDWWAGRKVVEKTRKETPGSRTQTSIILGGSLLTIVLLHAYMLVVIAFDYIAPETAAHVLTLLNAPFEPLVKHWYGPSQNLAQLVSHGYQNRVPIVAHSFIAAGFGSVFYLFSCLYYFLTNLHSLESIHTNFMEYYTNIPRGRGGKKLDRHPWFRAILGLFLGVVMGIIGVWIIEYRIHFPGEAVPGSAHLVWWQSFIYTDNIGLFNPIFMVGFVWVIPMAFALAFDPIYRVYLAVRDRK